MSTYKNGIDVLGRTTLGPRGHNILGARTKQIMKILGVEVREWDNHDTYEVGDVVYYAQKYWRAAHRVEPPFFPALMDGEVPGESSKWEMAAQSTVLGARTKQSDRVFGGGRSVNEIYDDTYFAGTVLGAAIDVDGLIERFDTLPQTNRTVWSLWVENGHGMALAQRVTKAAQDILNKALVPTNEFQFHDAVLLYAQWAKKLSDKVTAQPLNDEKSPIWDEVKQYFIDGSKMANGLEGVLDNSVKWSDVKDSLKQAADSAKDATKPIADALKWTYWIAIAAGVGVVGMVGYGAYRRVSGK